MTTDPSASIDEPRTICLCMIVKDESAIIERCLASVKPLIDHWVICDTGSTDDTPARITRFLEGIPGELHRRPWVNFGVNRTEALAYARGKADYILIVDADMTINAEPAGKVGLDADSYLLRYTGDLDYRQKLLVSGRRAYHYVGPVHEYIQATGPERVERLDAITVTHHADGSARPIKLQRGVELLSQARAADPNNARTVFYLAQNYRDLDRLDEAVEHYEMRVQMGGWEEEIFYSLYQIALIMSEQSDDWASSMLLFLRAYERRPSRLEPIYHIVQRFRRRKEYQTAILFAEPALSRPYPSDDILFIHRWMYTYGIPIEYAFCCAAVGRHEQAIEACDRVLARDDIPPRAREEAARIRGDAAARVAARG